MSHAAFRSVHFRRLQDVQIQMRLDEAPLRWENEGAIRRGGHHAQECGD